MEYDFCLRISQSEVNLKVNKMQVLLYLSIIHDVRFFRVASNDLYLYCAGLSTPRFVSVLK